MTELAYQSDELGLDEADKASARNLYMTPGTMQPTAQELINILRTHGRDQAVLEVALTLPLDEYRRVEEVYREVDPPTLPKIRRSR